LHGFAKIPASRSDDDRVRGEDTVKEMLESVRLALPFDGPFDD
jgi:hypothetical protein